MWLFSCLTLSRGTSECHSPNVHSKLNCQSGEVDPSGNYSPKAKNNRLPKLRRVGSSQSRGRRQGDPLQYPLKYWKGDTLGPPCDSMHCFFKIPVMCNFLLPKSLKITLIMKDQSFDPWHLLYPEDHMSQIMPCGPFERTTVDAPTVELYHNVWGIQVKQGKKSRKQLF